VDTPIEIQQTTLPFKLTLGPNVTSLKPVNIEYHRQTLEGSRQYEHNRNVLRTAQQEYPEFEFTIQYFVEKDFFVMIDKVASKVEYVHCESGEKWDYDRFIKPRIEHFKNEQITPKRVITKHVCDTVSEMAHDAFKKNVIKEYSLGTAFGKVFTNFGDSDYFWTYNSEYSSPIHYCPGCGLDLRTLLNKEGI